MWRRPKPHWLLAKVSGSRRGRFRLVAGNEDTILIFPADFSEYDGYLSTSVWKWPQKYRPQTAETEESPMDEAAK
jgi:hypothetical protein